MCSNFKDELLLELPVPFVTPGATMLLYFFLFLILSFTLFILFSFFSVIPLTSLTDKAQWLQVANPRVEKTALQCTKKSKLNQKCCS